MKKLSIFVSFAILLGVLSGCTLLYPNWGKPTSSPTKTDTESPKPTDTESTAPTPTDTNKAKADVEIMDSYVDSANGVLQVIAQVTNFSEDGGKCILTFNGGGKTSTITVTAESNAANTQCHPMEIPLSGLPKGSGVITVTYDSSKYHGISSSTPVTIQ